jgi:hypothetical protein
MMKVMTSELKSDIEQWTDQRKVFEEREDTSTYGLCRQREVSVEEKQKQLDQRGPTCEVATSAIDPPNDLKKLLEEKTSTPTRRSTARKPITSTTTKINTAAPTTTMEELGGRLSNLICYEKKSSFSGTYPTHFNSTRRNKERSV